MRRKLYYDAFEQKDIKHKTTYQITDNKTKDMVCI